ncbi:MAG: IS21 family transposase [candidate division Zixibacteria bacterium]|nr:IS21 family transposase [candidate division Zixibacteria bacterium]
MRKIREVLRLKHVHKASERCIATSCSVGRTAVAEYLRRAAVAGLSWPLPDNLDDEQLEQLLFPLAPEVPADQRPLPDWDYVHKELRRKGVTRFLLWQEYKSCSPTGLGYTQFCDRYLQWRGRQDPVMRQVHKAGEKLFVDYAGHTVPVTDRRTGEVCFAEIFVAVLGASSYLYCEATWSQGLPDWIASHIRAFEFFGGVPEVLVPDNLKSGVTSPHLYEPDLNPTYQDMAVHYGVAVVPARVRRPQDKAKAESGVQVAERWILARLRNRTFFSLAGLNQAIGELLTKLNLQPFQKLDGCRRSMFEAVDAAALKPLAACRYQYAEWKKVRVHIDYHVQVDKHYYSVPYQLVKEELDVRLTAETIELFRKNKRVASHVRSRKKGGFTTLSEHMPASHRHYAKWTPERLVRWAEETGGQTGGVITAILAGRPVPQQGFRACLGIMSLGKSYGKERLEAACARALALGTTSYKSIQSILKTGLDSQPLADQTAKQMALPIDHDNIRGPGYYHENGEGGLPC